MPDRIGAELARHFDRSHYQHDDDLVFGHPQTGRPYDASKMRTRFKLALKRAELRPLRFHDLRHTHGMLMAAAGAPLRTLQGWMAIGTTRRRRSTPTSPRTRRRERCGQSVRSAPMTRLSGPH